MLDSLESSLATYRRFAANASHELRTPLATARTMIDVTLADPNASAEQLRSLAERLRETNQANVETVDACSTWRRPNRGTSTGRRWIWPK